jgi:recombination protein RecA
MDTTFITTNNADLDAALGGGFAAGYLSEVFGTTHAERWPVVLDLLTSLAVGLGAVVDLRGDLDLAELADAGVDVSRLLVAQPDSLAEGYDIVERLTESDAVDLIVVNMPEPVKPEGSVGLEARLTSQATRRLCPKAYGHSTAIVFLCERATGYCYSRPVTPGSNALKYYCSQRVMVRREGDGELVAKVVKNKFAPPFGSAVLEAAA